MTIQEAWGECQRVHQPDLTVLETIANAVNGYRPFPGWPAPIRTLVERPPDVWNLAAATLLIAAGLVSLAIAIARRQDF